ncbi:MAG: UDP-N-acetylmuramoyl-tripeptide--D-alanyl-D-alanine ligase [Bacteriovoracales bacterium]|nr:UDP-N-acetylmuramoyl-tripeptide--D-alanyl-D-alanine ligase [Bacteriovoracales bacterium]
MIDSKIIFCPDWTRSIHPTTSNLPTSPCRISTDSRTMAPGDLFVALSGENFEGTDFAEEALKKGALGLVYPTRTHNNKQDQIPSLIKRFEDRFFIEVNDTHKYLKAVAKAHISQWKQKGGRVIGITGSNGKTTTKEMLAFLIESLIGDKLLYGHGSFNNQIGVPLTIFRLLPGHELAIIEMGTNQKGEIASLCDMALPDMGIITNVSKTHLEYLGDEDGVFLEKRALYDSVMKNSKREGAFILNADNPYLRSLSPNKNVITFGERFGSQKIQFRYGKVQIDDIVLKNTSITGKHNLTNLTCSFLMARYLFPHRVQELLNAAARFCPRPNRSSWVKRGRTDIFLDAYNANPTSMKMAIEGFMEAVSRADVSLENVLWIVGDMNELGEHTESCHEELGEILQNLGARHIIFVGRYYRYFKKGLPPKLPGLHHLQCTNDLKNTLGTNPIGSFEMVFIKGSRSLQLETFIDIK